MSFREFFTKGTFGEFGQLFGAGLMASLAGAALSAIGHAIFANNMALEMIDMVPLMILFVLGGLVLIPIAALCQVLLKEAAVGVFAVGLTLIAIAPLVQGIRYGLYTETIVGWSFGLIYATIFTFSIFGAMCTFLHFGRKL